MTFEIKGIKYSVVQQRLQDEYKCRVRGIFEHGLNGVRISCALYNTYDELDMLIYGVRKIAQA